MVIVESTLQFEKFVEDYRYSDCILVPILSDVKLHPIKNRLSLLFVKLLNKSNDEYILPFNHVDAINLPYHYIYELNFNNKKFVYSKKQLNHIISFDNVVDVNLLYYMESNEPLEIDSIETPAHEFYNRTFYKESNINDIIPIYKHLEYCRTLSDILNTCIHIQPMDKYNNEVIDILTKIESSGLYTKSGMVYTEYNIYTSTGRPSNRFGGTNFSALNKEDGSRKQFISRFKTGKLIEFDYDSFHVRLLADIVNYTFPPGSAHLYLMKEYGMTDYNKAKAQTFKYLYGKIPSNIIQQIPFFAHVQKYIDNLWVSYKTNNFIKSDIYNKRLYKSNLSNMTKNKLFNYVLQLLETEHNMKILSVLLPAIDMYKSKLILYNYDSFLFDYIPFDGKDFLLKVKSILEQNGKFPTKISVGNNYHNMKGVTL